MIRSGIKHWPIITLAALLLMRLGVQALLYARGFESMTADEFGRTVLAARWAEHPYMLWGEGPWLPFFMYMHGLALKLVWELLWVPRGLTIFFGLACIVLVYFLSWELFGNHLTALAAAALLAVNPFHVWLSSTPLTEVPYTALVLAFLLCFTLYLKSGRPYLIYLGALSLGFANGIRFEGWVVSAIFSLFLLGEALLDLWRRRAITTDHLHNLLGALLPWLIPIAWTAASYWQTRDIIASINLIKSYKSNWYGDTHYYLGYLKAFFEADPYLTVLGPAVAIMVVIYARRSRAIFWYAVFAVIPFLVFILIHQGQLEPLGNIKRYLAPFIFILYPAFAALLISVVEKLTPQTWTRIALVGSFILLVTVTQLLTTYRYIKDPVSDGLKVGLHIRELRQEDSDIASKPVLIELSYWQYLAILVGANDIQHIIYDRELDYENRESKSLITTDPEAFRRCLAQEDISYVIVKTRQLKDALEVNYDLHPIEKINKYSFYQIPERFKLATSTDRPCPLQ
jgi:Dolichyl-phosphate-mannose-protein mannosyltransferase